MNRVEIKNKIVEMVMEKNHVTFAEIEEVFEQFNFDYEGNLSIGNPEYNVIFWGHWNCDAIDLYREVENENKFEKSPVESIVYVIDGRVFNLPVVKRFMKYKNPHWLPVVLQRKV